MSRPLPDISTLRPVGGKRSTKRDNILRIFLGQEGHLSADDLCDLVRREEPGIGRATVYRTLQWMVGAGIARKVDFGEGRSRFEPSYRHPRHFHLVCTTCHRSSEFLSSDIETLVDEISERPALPAVAGGRAGVRHVRRLYQTGATTLLRSTARPRSSSSRAMRCAWRSPPSGAASISTRAPPASLPTRAAARVFQRLAEEEGEHLGTLEARYREASLPPIPSSNRGPRFSSSRRPPTVCSPRAPSSWPRAWTTSRRCSSASSASAAPISFFRAGTASDSRIRKASASSSSSPMKSACTWIC